jgi:nitrite reductase/ring-hydroxylating ferredoxin subunit
VWENVFDWEHLPALHEQDFHAVELLDSGSWGWRTRLVNQPGDASRAQILEMRADKRARRYVVSTLEGPGKGSQIATTLTARSLHRTEVNVEFLVPGAARNYFFIVAGYVEIYTRLWDQDETMMVRRERILSARRRRRRVAPKRKNLGLLAQVRASLPLLVPFGSETFRIVEMEDEMIAHAVTCPHWLGPLDETAIIDGCIRCPWHGYRFDVRTGANLDGHSLSLPCPPKVVVANGRVSLERPARRSAAHLPAR